MHATQDHADGGAIGPTGISRRQLLIGAGGLAGAVALGGATFAAVESLTGGVTPTLPSLAVKPAGNVRTFHSRPDLRPPTITLDTARDLDDGYLFLGPWASGGDQPGPLMVDQTAEPVWFNPVSTSQPIDSSLWGTNFRPWMYRGKPVIAWWEGRVISTGFGQGEAILLDSSYQEVARVRAANGRLMDMHEFHLTPEGTALFTCYPEAVPADLTSVGGPANGHVFESVFQEVDVRTGRLLLEWRSLDHVPITASYHPHREPFDYLHVNSIDVAPDGNLLISGRHAWALFKLDRHTGEVIWKLGGKNGDFQMGKGAQFAWQHHASYRADGKITLFDNGSDGPINTETRSRAVVLAPDLGKRTVKLAQDYHHPTPLLAVAMGSVQTLPSGNIFVGWGTEPYASEFTPRGAVVNDARMLSGYKSYRAFRVPWHGVPHIGPDVSTSQDSSTGKTTVYASWNGATDQAAYWQVHAGPRASDMRPVGIALRRGFETAIGLGRTGGYFAVTALDEDGSHMATSRTVRV